MILMLVSYPAPQNPITDAKISDACGQPPCLTGGSKGVRELQYEFATSQDARAARKNVNALGYATYVL